VVTQVDPNLDGMPTAPVYLTLDPLSPTRGVIGATSADVLTTVGGALAYGPLICIPGGTSRP